MKGYDPIRSHGFFNEISWDWKEMEAAKVPMRPPTPAASPVKLDPNRHGRSSSAWNELDNLKNEKVQNVSLEAVASVNNIDAAGSGSGSGSGSGIIARMNTDRNNEQLFERWFVCLFVCLFVFLEWWKMYTRRR